MGGAPVIVTIRPGVAFAPLPALSFQRAEASWGRRIGCNSSYRDYGLQLSMWQAWQAWTQGWGPKPNHSMALHPDASKHCQGYALDTPDISKPGFLAHMAEHGWIQILPNDPTERHHLEYQVLRDKHFGKPAGGGSTPFVPPKKEMDPMSSPVINVVPKQGDKADNGTLHTLRADGGSDAYGAPFAANIRGIISKVLYGGNGTEDKIPTLAQSDFNSFMRIWRSMCAGSGVTAAQVTAISQAIAKDIKVPAPTIDAAAIAKAVNDDVARRMTQ